MKFIKQQEINKILSEVSSIEEFNRIVRLFDIYLNEFITKLDSIWIINAKLDKLLKKGGE